jgi:hypothetical protein
MFTVASFPFEKCSVFNEHLPLIMQFLRKPIKNVFLYFQYFLTEGLWQITDCNKRNEERKKMCFLKDEAEKKGRANVIMIINPTN